MFFINNHFIFAKKSCTQFYVTFKVIKTGRNQLALIEAWAGVSGEHHGECRKCLMTLLRNTIESAGSYECLYSESVKGD